MTYHNRGCFSPFTPLKFPSHQCPLLAFSVQFNDTPLITPVKSVILPPTGIILDDSDLLTHVKSLIVETRRFYALARDIIGRDASLAEDVRGVLQNQQAQNDILRDAIESMSEQLTDIETFILAIATSTEQSRKASRAVDSMQHRQDVVQLRKLLEAENENRNRLMLQIAKQGGEATASVSLLTRLEKVEENIARIEGELDGE